MIVDNSGLARSARWIAEHFAGEWMATSAATHGVVVGLAGSGRSVRLRMVDGRLELWNAEDLVHADMRHVDDDVSFLLKMLARARCGCFALDCRKHGAYSADDVRRCDTLARDRDGGGKA